jgi:hypothetical protein
MITDTRADGTGNAMAEVVPDGTDQWSAGAELVGDRAARRLCHKPADADHPLRFECRIDADVTDGAGSLSAATTGTNPSASAAGSANAPPRASRRQA